MAIQLKKIAESPTTYAAYKALMEQWQGLFGNQNAVFANNGTTEVPEDAKNKIADIKVFDKDDKPIGYSKTYNDEKTAQAQEETWYKVTLDKADEATLEKDLKTVKFCFWIQNPKGETLVIDSPKKAIMITVKGNASSSDSTTDILEPKNTETLTKNLANAYHYAKIEYTKEEAILKIKWSKWLDRHLVLVEAYQKQINIKIDGGKTTASRYIKAKPEIIKGYWANNKREEITNKTVGYKDTVYMCLKTLGMKDQVVTTELWEEGITFMGSTYSKDETICMYENIEWKLTERISYKKLELPDKNDEEYKKQREGIWETDPLELYFKIPSEVETTGYKNKFGQLLNLTTEELISNAYFAKEIKQEVIEDGTVQKKVVVEAPKTHTVISGDNIYSVYKKYGIKDWMQFAKDNGVQPPQYILQLGKVLNLPDDAVMPESTTTAATEPKPEAQQETVYQPIDSASLGSEVWLVVESANLQGKKATIEIFDNQELLEDNDETAITILKDDTEVIKLENLTFNNEGQAKVKIKLRKKSDEDFKKQKEKFKIKNTYRNNNTGDKEALSPDNEQLKACPDDYTLLKKGETKIAKLYLKVTCDGTDKYHENKFLDCEEFEVKNTKSIHIYHDGTISKLDYKDLDKITYIYHDKNDKQYIICTCDLLKIDERLKGVADDKKTAHTVEPGYDANNIVSYSHAPSRKKYTYPDGTIRTYGKFYNKDKKTYFRLVTYKKGTSNKFIIKMPDSLNLKVGEKSVIYSFTGTARRYCGPEHFACFIGALAEEGYTLKSGGACEKDGTSYPSVSHINGQSIDTSYLNDVKEQNFINAMHKFGFLYQLRGKNKKKFTHTDDGGKLHDNHLHSGGIKPNYK